MCRKSPTRRRLRRGFSLMEALIASTVFLIGLTGVTFMSTHASMLSRRSTMNTQMAQLARDEMYRRTALGLTTVGATTMGTMVTLPSLIQVQVDVWVFDTSGAAGGEVVGQLPGCANLGFPSRCVRVRVTDPMVRDTSGTLRQHTYTEEQYVTASF